MIRVLLFKSILRFVNLGLEPFNFFEGMKRSLNVLFEEAEDLDLDPLEGVEAEGGLLELGEEVGLDELEVKLRFEGGVELRYYQFHLGNTNSNNLAIGRYIKWSAD